MSYGSAAIEEEACGHNVASLDAREQRCRAELAEIARQRLTIGFRFKAAKYLFHFGPLVTAELLAASCEVPATIAGEVFRHSWFKRIGGGYVLTPAGLQAAGAPRKRSSFDARLYVH